MHQHPFRWLPLPPLLVFACQTPDQQVGSACTDGVCEQSTAVQEGLTCMISSVLFEVANIPPEASAGLCLPEAVPTDPSGLISCRVRLSASNGLADLGLAACADQPSLESDPDDPDSCFVRQITAAQRATGLEDGWYYSKEDDCPRVDFTAGAHPPEQASIRLECLRAHAPDQDGEIVAVDPGLCRRPQHEPDAQRVGHACEPRILPEHGFDPRNASIEVPSAQCGDDVCLVYGLEGNPSADCAAPDSCPSEDAIALSVFCSCRCEVPEGEDGVECDCPDQFSCVDVLDPGPDDLRGGYCVRNDLLAR